MPAKPRPEWETPLAVFLIAAACYVFIGALSGVARLAFAIVSISRGY